MAEIHTETRGDITLRYINAQEGVRVYLLPGVPTDVGMIPMEKDFDLDFALEKFSRDHRDKAGSICEKYKGRQLDTASVLIYAQEQGKFEEYAQKLDDKPKDFGYIHPDLMLARTDVSAFFMGLLAELGIAPEKEARKSRKLVENYGTGVVIFTSREAAKDAGYPWLDA